MTFLSVGLLLGGVAAASIPIALHFMMQGRPKAFEFPTLRFIKQRLVVNRRRFRLKYLLLLLMRVLLLVLLGFALARPSLRLTSIGNLGSQEAPIAAVIVVDTSPRMTYLSANKTRLAEAQELAGWLLGQFPKNSQVAVLGSQRVPASFQVDLLAAKNRVDRLTTISAGRSVFESLAEGARLLKQSELERREIYVITDMTEPGWPETVQASAKSAIDGVPDAALYLLDVGLTEMSDAGFTKMTLSEQVISVETPLQLETELTHIGSQESRTAELYLKDALTNAAKNATSGVETTSIETANIETTDIKRAGTTDTVSSLGEKRGTMTVEFPAGTSKRNVTFRLTGLGEGTNQGVIRLTTPDALAADDQIFFSVEVQPPTRLLIVSPTDRYATFLQESLAPTSLKRNGIVPFLIDTMTFAELAPLKIADLTKYRAIFLLDPTPLPPGSWKMLADYAAQGNGVALFLGRNAEPVSEFNSGTARELLGVTLQMQVRVPDGDVWLAPDNYQNPALLPFREVDQTEIPWHVLPIFRYWHVDNLAAGTDIVANYSDGRPAVVTRPIGQGNVLVMTTPVSDLPNDDAWNLLPTSIEAPWVFLMLSDGIARFLVGTGEKNYNYQAGQIATLRPDVQQLPTSCIVTPPQGDGMRIAPDTLRKVITFPVGDPLGNYTVSAGGTGGVTAANRLQIGFSVNAPINEWDLTRITPERLKEMAGDRWQITKDRSKLEVGMAHARVGRELFPLILLLVLVVFSTEYLFANRFY